MSNNTVEGSLGPGKIDTSQWLRWKVPVDVSADIRANRAVLRTVFTKMKRGYYAVGPEAFLCNSEVPILATQVWLHADTVHFDERMVMSIEDELNELRLEAKVIPLFDGCRIEYYSHSSRAYAVNVRTLDLEIDQPEMLPVSLELGTTKYSKPFVEVMNGLLNSLKKDSLAYDMIAFLELYNKFGMSYNIRCKAVQEFRERVAPLVEKLDQGVRISAEKDERILDEIDIDAVLKDFKRTVGLVSDEGCSSAGFGSESEITALF